MKTQRSKKRKIIVAVVGGLVVWTILGTIYYTGKYSVDSEPTPPAVTPTVTVTHPEVSALFTLVNAERLKAGLAPLVDDPRLDASAAAKCADEARLQTHAHDLPDGTTPFTFIQSQVDHYLTAGENLSWNYPTSQTAVAGWMNSPGHRAAILNTRFTNVGYAVCNVSLGHNEVVQHFIGL